MREILPPLFEAIAESKDEAALAAAAPGLWDRFGETCAPLVLDSTGFTRTSRKAGILHFLRIFLRMREIAAPHLEAHGCFAWRSLADNLYAEFPSPDRALEAAMAIHHAVAEADLLLEPGRPFRVCIGIGWGRVLRADGFGVFGDEMNLACKLGEDIAEGGETLLTEAAFGALERRKATLFDRRETVISSTAIPFFAARR